MLFVLHYPQKARVVSVDDTTQMLKMKLDKGDVIKKGGEKNVY